MLVFVEGDAGGWGRNGAKLISERLWEDCLQPNPGPEAEFASGLAPTDYATEPLWEACLQANCQRQGK
ncbi:hypothetical protein BN2364_3979 [Alloalcanivorax xenomutans]|nr:hypothetical protein BN2364_3979 [Alloalcanivorax xenomutans]